MPKRSLHSSVLKWPSADVVRAALQRVAERLGREHREVERVGYFGSYTGSTWGVGSDLDVVIVLSASDLPFEERSRHYDFSELPVPADVLVYTTAEFQSLLGQKTRFSDVLSAIEWVYPG